MALRGAGNVFLGMAIGLLGYYAITDVVTRLEQQELKAEAAADFGTAPVVSEDGPTFDFEGWAEEDEAYWRDLKTGEAFGRIVAPEARVDSIVVKGVTRAALKRGPGWITYTDLPGPTGNCGISGHRTTYGAPFRHLDRLETGDTIEFYSPFRRYTYRVVKSFSVRPNRVDVVESTEEPRLTLTACDPPYSARLRLIVQAELVEVSRLSR